MTTKAELAAVLLQQTLIATAMRSVAGVTLPLAEGPMVDLVTLLHIFMALEAKGSARFSQQVTLFGSMRRMTDAALPIPHRGMQHLAVSDRRGNFFVAAEAKVFFDIEQQFFMSRHMWPVTGQAVVISDRSMNHPPPEVSCIMALETVDGKTAQRHCQQQQQQT